MTDKERLEEIKESYKYDLVAGNEFPLSLSFRDIKWLIQQAERVQELEKENKKLQAFYDYWAELYGKGLEIANWHMNGELEPFDSFFDSAEEELEGRMMEIKPVTWEEEARHWKELYEQQVERVKELEGQDPGIELVLLNDEIVKLEQQNLRYKQALNRVKNYYPGVPNAEYVPIEMLFEIHEIVRKALEGK